MSSTTEKTSGAAAATGTDTIVNYKPAYITMGVMLVVAYPVVPGSSKYGMAT